MADTAFQTQYRQEYIAAFEQNQSILRESCTTEADITGNTAVFLVAGSGGASAKTRGNNGLIPARADDNTQNSCTLEEWHDLVRKPNFNVFSSQGNQRQIMQKTTMGVLNRKTDSQILTALATGTLTTNSGVGVQASSSLVANTKTRLGNAGVPFDGNVWAVVTPAFMNNLTQLKEFASAEYVTRRPMDERSGPNWKDMAGFWWWNGVKWIEHPNLTGVGTSTASCFMYHQTAIGHAINKAGLMTPVGYDEEQDYSWARASAYQGAKLLQNTGVIEMVHDDSVLSAT
jgi:hypothetical protein